MQQQKIDESYILSVVSRDIYNRKFLFPVFVNPSNKEMVSLPRNIRVCIDFQNKNIYMWDSDILHKTVSETMWSEGIKLNYSSSDKRTAWLEAMKDGKKVILFGLHTMIEKMMYHDDVLWLKRYVSFIMDNKDKKYTIEQVIEMANE
jgi:hypothetical protein